MPNCVCCGIETNGTYNNRFPVCFGCYESGRLKNFLLTLDDTKLVHQHWFELIKARDELKELEIEAM
jgi:hypothetical protein